MADERYKAFAEMHRPQGAGDAGAPAVFSNTEYRTNVTIDSFMQSHVRHRFKLDGMTYGKRPRADSTNTSTLELDEL